MIVKLDDKCEICDHDWRWHYPNYPVVRHLVGGWEYAPLYCYCQFKIPETNLEYLEYMAAVNGMKGLKNEPKFPM
jgi:hypothetical protein